MPRDINIEVDYQLVSRGDLACPKCGHQVFTDNLLVRARCQSCNWESTDLDRAMVPLGNLSWRPTTRDFRS